MIAHEIFVPFVSQLYTCRSYGRSYAAIGQDVRGHGDSDTRVSAASVHFSSWLVGDRTTKSAQGRLNAAHVGLHVQHVHLHVPHVRLHAALVRPLRSEEEQERWVWRRWCQRCWTPGSWRWRRRCCCSTWRGPGWWRHEIPLSDWSRSRDRLKPSWRCPEQRGKKQSKNKRWPDPVSHVRLQIDHGTIFVVVFAGAVSMHFICVERQ